MMIGIVSRLTDQKGFDLIAYMMDEMCQDEVQIVVLGTGDAKHENMFRHFAWKYDKKVSANIYYSEELSHRIYGSCDAFLMPSLFEPEMMIFNDPSAVKLIADGIDQHGPASDIGIGKFCDILKGSVLQNIQCVRSVQKYPFKSKDIQERIV